MTKRYKITPIIYSVTSHFDSVELKYGEVRGQIDRGTTRNTIKLNEVIISSRTGDTIFISDLNALECLAKTLQGIVNDVNNDRIEFNTTRYTTDD